MSTHEDWLDARRWRDYYATMAVSQLNADNVEMAREAAWESRKRHAEMDRISLELDGES